MKKILIFCTFLMVLLAFSACSNIQSPHFEGGENMNFDSVNGEGVIYN